ncbi:hypothetical protein IWW36_001831 [Coemansia brasiliensis]|uniref:SGF29 C-terminal domain-containing protein n=1 Tax=Coemansia brasiliensis TaxID=2650707 RepID=A0A9W8M169_9FUNG|nr:hypothetical protein IWW36_001831 [Coemansia brasiliensis]
MLLTAEQVLARIKHSGEFDAMCDEMLAAFAASEQGQAFDSTIRTLLQRLSEDVDSTRVSDKAAYFERRLVDQLKRNGRMERMERDARNYWLHKDKQAALTTTVQRAISDARKEGDSASIAKCTITRPLEIDPPRLSSYSSSRSHNFYRRRDAVAAFVTLSNSLCTKTPQYICLALEIDACDSIKNMYTVYDTDALASGQNRWSVYWDQLLAIKRPYEQVYRIGDQVYALFRDDYGTDTAVSTEFFPGRVEEVSKTTLAIRFDTGDMCHVYYDEVFAAGRVGFMRQMSEERRRSGGADAVVEVGGRVIPSFTGFWPETAQPALGKYGRKVRYRPLPPLLIEHTPYKKTSAWKEQAESAPSPAQHSSDMDIDSSVDSPPPSKTTASVSQHTETKAPVNPLVPVPSSEEEGEIEATSANKEDGEVVDRPGSSRWPSRTPESRDRAACWQSRSPAYRNGGSRHRRDSRSRSRWSNRSRDNRSRDRSHSSRDASYRDYSRRRYSGRYHDEYRPRYRSRSRSRSLSPSRSRPRLGPYERSPPPPHPPSDRYNSYRPRREYW